MPAAVAMMRASAADQTSGMPSFASAAPVEGEAMLRAGGRVKGGHADAHAKCWSTVLSRYWRKLMTVKNHLIDTLVIDGRVRSRTSD